MSEERAMGPWEELGEVMGARSQPAGRYWAHPPKAVLSMYLAGELPSRPKEWTKERVRALLAGRVSDWTAWEVMVHLRTCPKCRRTLARLKKTEARQLWLTRILGSPKLAGLGWALAGAQAMALAALILFFSLSSPPHKLDTQPELTLPSTSSEVTFVSAWVVPETEVDIGEFSRLLHSLGIVVVDGPDDRGGYKVVGQEEAIQRLSESPLINLIQKEVVP
ncbi:MAG: hypothetical protein H5U03_05690 [Clostridia bacterium]|nr:hypothetical protein [Clostridia bacterium]